MLSNPRNAVIYFGFIGLATMVLLPLYKYTEVLSLYIITDFKNPPAYLVIFFKENEIYKLLYNYCSTSFFIYTMFYIGFFIKINILVQRKCIYWKKMGIRYMLSFLSSLHLYAFGLLCHNNIHLIESFLMIEVLVSMFNIPVFGYLMKKHNQILIDINNHNDIGDIYEIEN